MRLDRRGTFEELTILKDLRRRGIEGEMVVEICGRADIGTPSAKLFAVLACTNVPSTAAGLAASAGSIKESGPAGSVCGEASYAVKGFGEGGRDRVRFEAEVSALDCTEVDTCDKADDICRRVDDLERGLSCATGDAWTLKPRT